MIPIKKCARFWIQFGVKTFYFGIKYLLFLFLLTFNMQSLWSFFKKSSVWILKIRCTNLCAQLGVKMLHLETIRRFSLLPHLFTYIVPSSCKISEIPLSGFQEQIEQAFLTLNGLKITAFGSLGIFLKNWAWKY